MLMFKSIVFDILQLNILVKYKLYYYYIISYTVYILLFFRLIYRVIIHIILLLHVFDLILANHEVYYKVSFSYPDNEAKAIEQKIAKEELAKEERFVDKELNKTTIPRNWDYYMNINKDSENITPNFAYDDGLFTYLGFDSTKTIPSVFKYENEKESILNTHVKKDGVYDVLVIHKTTKMIVLRSGNKIVGILNGSFGVNPLPVPNNTISNKVDREVIDGNK